MSRSLKELEMFLADVLLSASCIKKNHNDKTATNLTGLLKRCVHEFQLKKYIIHMSSYYWTVLTTQPPPGHPLNVQTETWDS